MAPPSLLIRGDKVVALISLITRFFGLSILAKIYMVANYIAYFAVIVAMVTLVVPSLMQLFDFLTTATGWMLAMNGMDVRNSPLSCLIDAGVAGDFRIFMYAVFAVLAFRIISPLSQLLYTLLALCAAGVRKVLAMTINIPA